MVFQWNPVKFKPRDSMMSVELRYSRKLVNKSRCFVIRRRRRDNPDLEVRRSLVTGYGCYRYRVAWSVAFAVAVYSILLLLSF